jgi:hypothetical protein
MKTSGKTAVRMDHAVSGATAISCMTELSKLLQFCPLDFGHHGDGRSAHPSTSFGALLPN